MEARQANIPFNPKARNIRSTKAGIITYTTATQQIICIGQRLRPSVGDERIQTFTETPGELCLQ